MDKHTCGANELIGQLLKLSQVGTDLFGKRMTSSSKSQFSYQNEYNKGETQWVEKVTGTASATHDPADATVDLTVSAPSSRIIRQTRKYMRYFSGDQSTPIMTFATDEIPAGVTFRCGYFDNDNGVFFSKDAVGDYITLRAFGVDTTVQRSGPTGWNKNKLIGYDFSFASILQFRLQWLGVGNVMIVFEDTDGTLTPVHVFENVGVKRSTYMRTANLPIRYEVESDETFVGTYTAKQICSSYKTEDGGCGPVSAYEHGVDSGMTPISVGTTRRAVLAVRPKTTFNGIVNRATAIIKEIKALVGGADVRIELVFDPVYGGTPTWESINDNSSLEVSRNVNTFTGGIVTLTDWGQAGQGNTKATVGGNVQTNYPMGLDVDGLNPTSFAVVLTALSGTATVNTALGLEEIY